MINKIYKCYPWNQRTHKKNETRNLGFIETHQSYVGMICFCQVNLLGSDRQRSVYLITHFLGGLSRLKRLISTCAHSFSWIWQLPFLNQRKGENHRRKYFMMVGREWPISTKECFWALRGSNPQPPDDQPDAHPTGPPRPAWRHCSLQKCTRPPPHPSLSPTTNTPPPHLHPLLAPA